MEKKIFETLSIEVTMYRYPKQLKLIEKLKHKVVIMWKQKEQVEKDIRETNVSIETELNMGIDYGERVQT